MFDDRWIIVRGAGDLATGVCMRLWRCGFKVIMTEISRPLTVRRKVAFSEAVFKGEIEVEGLPAHKVDNLNDISAIMNQNIIPVIIDPYLKILKKWTPDVLVDAIMAKKNIGTDIQDAPLVIGLGPGFSAGKDVHAVVETKRGHNLGRVIWKGEAEHNTGVPGQVMGISKDRVIRSPENGVFYSIQQIGDQVKKGDLIGYVDNIQVHAPISGILRGLIHDQMSVNKEMKIGDIDPRGIREYCWTISEKAFAIGGGVLEAILSSLKKKSDQIQKR